VISLTDDIDNTTNDRLLLEIEDEIIAKFCEYIGGMELAMPIIRKQYDILNIDFKNPSKEDLIKLTDRLVQVTEQIKGEASAREQRRQFKNLLIRLETNQ